jgi:alpha-beta hydrolase superfamily lysophospholipase
MPPTGLWLMTPLFLPEIDRIAPVSAVAAIPPSTPVLFLAGGADERARPEEARALYEPIAAPARLVVLDGAKHESLLAHSPARYRAEIERLLRQVAAPR